ncbi:hypothetical protein [Falsiroseomonas sp.]|uniref:hypothetical protein n=1 Tax=Falsiroseomonas sp. TaxID=2870721 RepID=UPI003F71957B
MLVLFVPVLIATLVSALLDIGLRQQLRPGVVEVVGTQACTGNQAGLTSAMVALIGPEGQRLEAVWPCWRVVPTPGTRLRALYRSDPAHLEPAGTRPFSPRTFAGFLFSALLLGMAALGSLSSGLHRRALARKAARAPDASTASPRPARTLDPISFFRSLGIVALTIGGLAMLAGAYDATRTWQLLSHGEPQVAEVLSAWPSGGRANTWKTTFALTGPDGGRTTAIWDSETFLQPGTTVEVLVDRRPAGQVRPAETQALWGFARRMAVAGGIYLLIGLHFLALGSLIRWVLHKQAPRQTPPPDGERACRHQAATIAASMSFRECPVRSFGISPSSLADRVLW